MICDWVKLLEEYHNHISYIYIQKGINSFHTSILHESKFLSLTKLVLTILASNMIFLPPHFVSKNRQPIFTVCSFIERFYVYLNY